jgi:hypothetical protein
MAGMPVTVGHVGRITPANVAAKVGQTVTDAVREGQYLTAVVQIEDAGTIARIDSGELVELSAGYNVREHSAEAGSYNGMRYDSVQRGIVYNHIALLPRGEGRAGSDVSLRLDSAADVGYATGVGTITLDGVPYEVPDAIAAGWDRMCAMCEKYQAEEMAEAAAEQAVEAVTEAAVAAVQAAPEPAAAPVMDSIEPAIAERVLVLDQARSVIPGLKFEGQSVRQLQELVLAKRGVRCDSQDNGWVAGAFAACLAAPAVASITVTDAKDAPAPKPAKSADEVRAEALAAKADAWKVKR